MMNDRRSIEDMTAVLQRRIIPEYSDKKLGTSEARNQLYTEPPIVTDGRTTTVGQIVDPRPGDEITVLGENPLTEPDYVAAVYERRVPTRFKWGDGFGLGGPIAHKLLSPLMTGRWHVTFEHTDDELNFDWEARGMDYAGRSYPMWLSVGAHAPGVLTIHTRSWALSQRVKSIEPVHSEQRLAS